MLLAADILLPAASATPGLSKNSNLQMHKSGVKQGYALHIHVTSCLCDSDTSGSSG